MLHGQEEMYIGVCITNSWMKLRAIALIRNVIQDE